ncbi:MAG TPA: stage 0 sporulation protein, partial [Clostridia bacterium]|nr:stage 0 sporulation protein [Clostridia bacterium]
MLTVIGVRFKKAGKIYYFDPGDLNTKVGDQVIVETSRGIEFGDVVVGPKQVSEEEVVQPLKKVIRIATDEDREVVRVNKEKEKEAFRICLQKIKEHGLPMKLIDVEYTFDVSKIIFYFTAEGRG